MRVLLVDWLGRGGIAQTTDAWDRALRGAGIDVAVATRPGRELRCDLDLDPGPGSERHGGPAGALAEHRRLVSATAAAIRAEAPDHVVVQSYVVPILEAPVYAAARAAGVRVTTVVHNAAPHARTSGTTLGLRANLRRSDAVLAHSALVAEQVRRRWGTSAQVLPHPLVRSVLDAERPAQVLPPSDRPTAVTFGVLGRGYKGTGRAVQLARSSPSWRFALVGRGAPAVEGAVTLDGYVPNGVLARILEESAVALLPYRAATQSGAVVLAQALGAVPVVTAVGGIPEQVDDGRTGRLVPPGAPLARWRDVLTSLEDPAERARLASAARADVEQAHRRFEATARAVATGAGV
jgi:glycosyltransferase involved in cell wall biosynthesis